MSKALPGCIGPTARSAWHPEYRRALVCDELEQMLQDGWRGLWNMDDPALKAEVTWAARWAASLKPEGRILWGVWCERELQHNFTLYLSRAERVANREYARARMEIARIRAQLKMG